MAVASDRFNCDGNELMGISVAAPLYAAIEGMGTGETCKFNGREIEIEAAGTPAGHPRADSQLR